MSEPTTALAAPDHLSLLRLAVEKGARADELEKLAALAERLEANRAKAAFTASFNACQKEMPVFVRDAQNKRVSSERKTYIYLETIQAALRPIYTKHGFAISWSQGDVAKEGYTRVIGKLHHVAGHSEQYQGDYPLDGRGAKGGEVMNPLQGTVSSHTYAQRDMLRLMFNLTIADYDLDGEREPAPSEGILADQLAELNALARAADSLPGQKMSMAKFCKWVSAASKREVTGFEQFDQNQFLIAKAELLAVIKEKEGSKQK
jgi:hypothetical protein